MNLDLHVQAMLDYSKTIPEVEFLALNMDRDYMR
jgi:hypothetical protein